MVGRLLIGVCPGLAYLTSGIALAHHSVTANFDTGREIEVRGSVVDFNYVSPHASLVIDGIAYEDGKPLTGETERWEIESSAVKGLLAQGIKADTFQPGDGIIVRGAPHKNSALRRMNSSRFFAANGGPLALERAPRPGPVEAPDAEGVDLLAGRWTPPYQREGTSSVLPLNAAGLAAWEAYDQTLSPANTCEPMSIPVVMNAPGYLVEIKFADGSVRIRNEAYDVDRTVPLGNEYAPADPNGQWGDLRGRIEGDVLIVESKDYPPSKWGLGAATQINGGGGDVPSSERKTVVERFSTSADGLALNYDYVLFDPEYMSREHEARVVLRRAAPDATMLPYACDVAAASQFSRAPGVSVLSTDE